MNKKILIWSLVLFCLVSFVSAQYYYGYGGDLFGLGDIVDLYNTYPGWFDFFIFLVTFISLGKSIFKDKLGTGVAVGIGLVLAFGFVLWERQVGFTLASFGPFVLLICFLIIFYWIFNLLRGISGFGLTMASLAFVIFMLFKGSFVPGYWWDTLPQEVVSVLWGIFVLASIYLIFKLSSWFKGLQRKEAPERGLREEERERKGREKEELKKVEKEAREEQIKENIEGLKEEALKFKKMMDEMRESGMSVSKEVKKKYKELVDVCEDYKKYPGGGTLWDAVKSYGDFIKGWEGGEEEGIAQILQKFDFLGKRIEKGDPLDYIVNDYNSIVIKANKYKSSLKWKEISKRIEKYKSIIKNLQAKQKKKEKEEVKAVRKERTVKELQEKYLKYARENTKFFEKYKRIPPSDTQEGQKRRKNLKVMDLIARELKKLGAEKPKVPEEAVKEVTEKEMKKEEDITKIFTKLDFLDKMIDKGDSIENVTKYYNEIIELSNKYKRSPQWKKISKRIGKYESTINELQEKQKKKQEKEKFVEEEFEKLIRWTQELSEKIDLEKIKKGEVTIKRLKEEIEYIQKYAKPYKKYPRGREVLDILKKCERNLKEIEKEKEKLLKIEGMMNWLDNNVAKLKEMINREDPKSISLYKELVKIAKGFYKEFPEGVKQILDRLKVYERDIKKLEEKKEEEKKRVGMREIVKKRMKTLIKLAMSLSKHIVERGTTLENLKKDYQNLVRQYDKLKLEHIMYIDKEDREALNRALEENKEDINKIENYLKDLESYIEAEKTLHDRLEMEIKTLREKVVRHGIDTRRGQEIRKELVEKTVRLKQSEAKLSEARKTLDKWR